MKAIQYIEDESFVVVNPDYPVVSKENALKAVEMAENEVKEKAIVIFNDLIFELEENPDMTPKRAVKAFQESINLDKQQ